MARSLARRSAEPEWMDAQSVPQPVMDAVMRDLAAVNRWTFAYRPTLAWLRRHTRSLPQGARYHLVDVGSGEGDMLRAVRRLARELGHQPVLTGYDLNPRCAAAARAATDPALGIDYVVGDATEAVARADFVISSLVAHHMEDGAIVHFVRWMERTAVRGWFVNDLHRHWAAYHGFSALAWAARWHPFVRHDGPLSVARAFRVADWRRYLCEAQVNGAKVAWWFPFRLCVARERSP